MAHDETLFLPRSTPSLAACEAMMRAAVAEAKTRGLKMTIAIVDAGGTLLHLSRMDDIHAGTVEVAIAKAKSAALFKRPTKAFADGYAGGATALPALPNVLPFAGGLPILVDGALAGAIGASGAAPDEDAAVAAAGIAAVLGA